MADHARVQFGYDKVILVPSFRPPHKVLADDPGPEHRKAMLLKLCMQDRHFVTDDCEIARAGTSYTVDTIALIIEFYKPDGKPGFLLGDDLVPGFSSWKDPERIAEMAELIVAGREEQPPPDFLFPHRNADNERLPISSSMIRQRIRNGSAFRYLVPGPVFDYIVEKGLYGFR